MPTKRTLHPPPGEAERQTKRLIIEKLEKYPGVKWLGEDHPELVSLPAGALDRHTLVALIGIAQRQGQALAQPITVPITVEEVEIPLRQLDTPNDVIDALTRVGDKSFLDDGDLGAAAAALDEMLDLRRIFAAGMHERSRADLSNSALKWTLDTLEKWDHEDYATLGSSLREMYRSLGLCANYHRSPFDEWRARTGVPAC